jgi:prepilin-type processing-associated H-X9-DG protein
MWASNPDKLQGLLARPPFFVCPSSQTLPVPSADDPISPPSTTSCYALVSGIYGPSYGTNADKIKLHNTGPFVYLLVRKLKDITDGLTCSAFVGEIREGHLPASRNVWNYANRHRDSLRTTEALLNTPPGALIPPYYSGDTDKNGKTIIENAAFGSDHPGGANFLFGDGHVKFIKDTVSHDAYNAMATIAGKDDVINRAATD